jgi:hypothetical protein
MRPSLPHNLNPLPPKSSGWGLAFQAVNSVSLAIVTSKMLLDMLRDRKEARHKAQATDETLGPLVRREVERALAAHDTRRGGGAREDRGGLSGDIPLVERFFAIASDSLHRQAPRGSCRGPGPGSAVGA